MTENNYNDAVFDALLKKAVIENFERELTDISNGELALKYTFSERHEERMRRLFKRERAKQYIWQSLMVARRIAAVFIVAIALIFGLLMFDNGVRAEVKKILIELYEKFTSFQFTGEEQVDTFEWQPTYVSTKPMNQSIGTDGQWNTATELLKQAVINAGLEYEIDEGGGAFYGPKIG